MSSFTKPPLFLRVLGFLFRVLCIFAVDLVVAQLNTRVLGLSSLYPKPLVILIGMVVVLCLFYFLVSIIDRFTKYIFKVTIEMGNFLKFRKTAMLVIILGMYVGMFQLYSYSWFQKWTTWEELRSALHLPKAPRVEIQF